MHPAIWNQRIHVKKSIELPTEMKAVSLSAVG